MDPPIGPPRMQYSQIEGIGCCGYSGFTSAMCGVYPTHTLKPSWSTIWNFTTVSMFRLFGTSLSHNYHPCMAKLPTFGSFCMGNVGKCRWIYHTWKLMCTHDVLYVLHVLSTFGEGAKKNNNFDESCLWSKWHNFQHKVSYLPRHALGWNGPFRYMIYILSTFVWRRGHKNTAENLQKDLIKTSWNGRRQARLYCIWFH